MKFLGLRVEDHDSNITYTDGKTVKYCSTERKFGIKHHGFNNNWQWKDILSSWNIDINDVDAVAIITDGIQFERGENYREVNMGLPCKTFAVDHHWAHVLSLWPLGNIPNKNYVFDGFGNNDRSHSFYIDGNLKTEHNINTSGSIGVCMANVGDKLGLSKDEWGLDLAGKVMGLQSYGFIDEGFYKKLDMHSLKNIIDIWDYSSWHRKWNDDFDINWLRTVHELTGDKLAKYVGANGPCEIPVGYSGGVAQNCVFNGKILATGQKVMIPPHANDCGLSLGAVEFLRQYFHEEEFDSTGFPFWQDDESTVEPDDQTIDKAAQALCNGHIVGWYMGSGEIGPRALGHRSILMTARNKKAKDIINKKVKHREHFRPFGAAVLREDVNKFFDFDGDSPYMNTSVKVIDKELSSVTHVDRSCRIQTVHGDDCFARLMRRYKELSGDGVLLNTSMNVAGKPIASSHWEAKELFSKKGINHLFVGNEYLSKVDI